MYEQQAILKLQEELKQFKENTIASTVKEKVEKVLETFCHQNDEFAQAIVQNDSTLHDCCKEITKNINANNAKHDGHSSYHYYEVSDLEVYRQAVQFYFKGADIEMHMTINLCGSEAAEKPAGKVLSLSLDDLFAD